MGRRPGLRDESHAGARRPHGVHQRHRRGGVRGQLRAQHPAVRGGRRIGSRPRRPILARRAAGSTRPPLVRAPPSRSRRLHFAAGVGAVSRGSQELRRAVGVQPEREWGTRSGSRGVALREGSATAALAASLSRHAVHGQRCRRRHRHRSAQRHATGAATARRGARELLRLSGGG